MTAHLCKCKTPNLDIVAGRFNCGGAYVCTCLDCGKVYKMGKENYSRMIQPATPKLCTPHHDHPVHFKLKGSFAWVCLACGKQLAGPKLTPTDVDAFTQFGRFLSDDGEANEAERPEGSEGRNQMKLEVSMLVGPESKAWLVSMEGLLARMEKLAGVTGSKKAAASKDEEEEEEAVEAGDDGEEDFGAKKSKAKKKAKGFDEEEEEEEAEEESEEEEEEEEVAPKKKAKKKIDLDDVNDACKKKCVEEGGGKEGRKAVLAILKKYFKTESVTELKPEQYAKAIELME